MSTLRFTDGMTFDMTGPLRITRRRDGMYVIGEGMLVPVNDEEEAQRLIDNIKKTRDSK